MLGKQDFQTAEPQQVQAALSSKQPQQNSKSGSEGDAAVEPETRNFFTLVKHCARTQCSELTAGVHRTGRFLRSSSQGFFSPATGYKLSAAFLYALRKSNLIKVQSFCGTSRAKR